MKTIEILRAAKELIRDESSWTQRCAARTHLGVPVLPADATAVKWCALGACDKLGRNVDRADCRAALANAAIRLFDADIVEVNDYLGHGAVLRMFDSAIRSLQRKAKKRKPASNRKNANRKKAKR